MILVNECTAGVDGTYWYNWMRMIQTILAHCSDGWSLLLFILLFFFSCLIWKLPVNSSFSPSEQCSDSFWAQKIPPWTLMNMFFVCIFACVCVHCTPSLPCTHTGLSSAWKRSHEGNINLCVVTISSNRSIGLHLHPLFFLCVFCHKFLNYAISEWVGNCVTKIRLN